MKDQSNNARLLQYGPMLQARASRNGANLLGWEKALLLEYLEWMHPRELPIPDRRVPSGMLNINKPPKDCHDY